MTTETPAERRERLRALQKTMSNADIARQEGITRQRLQQLIGYSRGRRAVDSRRFARISVNVARVRKTSRKIRTFKFQFHNPELLAKVITYCRNYEASYGRTPSIRQIARHFQVSHETSRYWINRLESDGRVSREFGFITVLEKEEA